MEAKLGRFPLRAKFMLRFETERKGAHERRDAAMRDPDAGVRRLLPNERRDESCDAAELDLHHVVRRLPLADADTERLLAEIRHLEMHEPRVGRHSEHRQRQILQAARHVLEQRRRFREFGTSRVALGSLPNSTLRRSLRRLRPGCQLPVTRHEHAVARGA